VPSQNTPQDDLKEIEVAGATYLVFDPLPSQLAAERQRTINDLARAAQVLQEQPTQLSITLAEWLDQWIKSGRGRKGPWDPRTRDSHESICRVHIKPKLGGYRLDQLNKAIIDEFFDNLPKKLNQATRSHIRATLHAALESAVEREYLNSNPASHHHEPLKYSGKDIRPLWPHEVELLLSHREIEFYDEIAFAVTTGVRQGEELALRWSYLELDSKRPSVRIVQSLDQYKGREDFKDVKTYIPRRIRLFPSSVKILRDRRQRIYFGPDSLVFSDDGKTPRDATGLTKSFSKSLKKLKIRHVRYQDLRHTHATFLLNGTRCPPWFPESEAWPIKAVQERLGHSSAKMTLDQYGHFMPGMQDSLIDNSDGQRFLGKTAGEAGASGGTRTLDQRFTKPLLYH
jgi:integrase